VTALFAVGLLLTTGTAATAPAPSAPPPRPVVLVLVPDLDWHNAPAALRGPGYARANVSVRSARQRGGPADGYASIGAGARAIALARSGVGRIVDDVPGARLLDWSRLQRRQDDAHTGARLGALGEQLRRHGRSWAFAGTDERGAVAAADASGRVPVAFFAGDAGVPSALRSAFDAVIVAETRHHFATVLDVAQALSRCVMVASVSTRSESRHLGAFAASRSCGLGAGGLRSASTHQRGLMTITDVTTAFLAALDVKPGDAMTGGSVRPGGSGSVSALVDRDERSAEADYVRTRFIWLFVALHAGAAFVALWRPALRRILACVLLSVIPASFLMMVVSWWEWGVAGAVVVATALVVGLALVVMRIGRDDAPLVVGAAAAVAAAVVGVDAAFGGRLEIDAPFGSSPIGGGRFYGVGNIPFAFLIAALLVAGALSLERWGRRAAPWVGAALAAGLVVDGAPFFGADAGGILASAPAYGALIASHRRGRPSVKLLAALFVAGVAIFGLFAVVDSLRPRTSQTHETTSLGGSSLTDTVVRKGERALNTITTPMANIVVVGVAVVAAARPRLKDRPALQAGAWALVIGAVLGSALNDSGLQVAAGVVAVAWPSYLAVASEP
jgi:hypothetical protein